MLFLIDFFLKHLMSKQKFDDLTIPSFSTCHEYKSVIIRIETTDSDDDEEEKS